MVTLVPGQDAKCILHAHSKESGATITVTGGKGGLTAAYEVTVST